MGLGELKFAPLNNKEALNVVIGTIIEYRELLLKIMKLPIV
jgi:hypothetical protein